MNNNVTDNRLVNLKWGTHADNMQDKLRSGNNTNANKTRCPQGHSYEDAYTTVDSNGHNRRMCRTCYLDRASKRDPARRAKQDKEYYERNKERIRARQKVAYEKRKANAMAT